MLVLLYFHIFLMDYSNREFNSRRRNAENIFFMWLKQLQSPNKIDFLLGLCYNELSYLKGVVFDEKFTV